MMNFFSNYSDLISRSVMTAVAKSVVIPHYRRKLHRFEASLANGHRLQRRSLFANLHRNATSDFGKKHDFAGIKTIDDFRRRVPICEYDYLAPYIAEVSQGRQEALFSPTEEILAFSCTTGTTGQPKLNPVTRTWLNQYRSSLETWGVKSIVEHPEMIGRRVLQLLGPGNLDTTPSGLSVGMVSAIAAKFQNRVYQSFYAVPPETADIADSFSKYYLTMRLAMATTVGFVIAITPSNLIRLAEVGDQYREQLIRDIHDGTLWDKVHIPVELQRRVSKSIRTKNPQRARFLEQVIERTGTLYPKDYWPLSLISCWLGGTVGYQARELPRFYGDTPTRDLGLISTEGRHTIPLHDGLAEGVLAVDGAYYEFIPFPEDSSGASTRVRTLECDELEPGAEYSLVLTTSSGLYRYSIGDIVRCVGYVGQAPILQFLHKVGQYADMEGEKISGFQMAAAVETAARELQLPLNCFTAVPVRPDGQLPYYGILLERQLIEETSTGRRLIEIIDRELIHQNIMYAGKRHDGYIDSPRIIRLAPGTWTAYAASEARKNNGGDSQYKHAVLVPDTSWLSRFQPLDTVRLDSAV